MSDLDDAVMSARRYRKLAIPGAILIMLICVANAVIVEMIIHPEAEAVPSGAIALEAMGYMSVPLAYGVSQSLLIIGLGALLGVISRASCEREGWLWTASMTPALKKEGAKVSRWIRRLAWVLLCVGVPGAFFTYSNAARTVEPWSLAEAEKGRAVWLVFAGRAGVSLVNALSGFFVLMLMSLIVRTLMTARPGEAETA